MKSLRVRGVFGGRRGVYIKTRSADDQRRKCYTIVTWDEFLKTRHSTQDVEAIKRINQMNCNLFLPSPNLLMKVDYPTRYCFPQIRFRKPINELRVLEVGCGWGRSTQFYSAFCRHVVSVDFSASSVLFNRRHTRKRTGKENVDHIVNNLTEAVNCAHEFDYVALVHVLSFLPPTEGLKLMCAIDDLAKPGTHIMLSDFNILNHRLRAYATTFWNMRKRSIRNHCQGLDFQQFVRKFRSILSHRMTRRGTPVINGQPVKNHQQALERFDETVEKIRHILRTYQAGRLYLPLSFYGEGYKSNILFYWRVPLFPWEINAYLEHLPGSWKCNFLDAYTHKTTYGPTIEAPAPVKKADCFVLDLEKIE